MCFRDPYDVLDISIMRELSGMLLDDAMEKEERRKAKEQKKEQLRQTKEQKKIAKVKERLERKYGPMLQPSPKRRNEPSSTSLEDTESRRHRWRHRQLGDSENVPKPRSAREDMEDSPAHTMHIEFGEFHSAPPPPPPPKLEEPSPPKADPGAVRKAARAEKASR